MSMFRAKHAKRRRKFRRNHRVLKMESLESRLLLAGDLDADISLLSDEFDDGASIAAWERVNEVESWNADQLHTWDVDQTQAGRMVMQPETAVWYQDWRGPMAFKEVAGDFVFTTEVFITDRDDVGGSDADDVPGDALFSLGGVMIRTPRDISDPAIDWAPGSFADDGTNDGENYVFLSLGYTSGANNFSLEVKTTRNSDSHIEIDPVGVNTAKIQLAKIGDSVIALYQLLGEDWQVHRRYTRTDMPEAVQVGLVTYSDWDKASDYDPFVHNGAVLIEGELDDPTPAEPYNPDVTAGFEYARYARPLVPAELTGVDLVNAASAEQLLSFLGDNLAESPADMSPILDLIIDQAIPAGVDSLTIELPPALPTGEPLAYTAAIAEDDGDQHTVSIDGYQLTIDPADEFAGSFDVDLDLYLTNIPGGAPGEGGPNASRRFNVTVANSAPVVEAINDQEMSVLDAELRVAYSASDPDGDDLTIEVEVIEPETYQLDQEHDFTSSGNYHDNWGGQNERWVNGDGSDWFYLLPNGELHEWASSFEASPLLASLGSNVYDDPSLLTDAEAIPVEVSINGDEIVVTPTEIFVGEFAISVSATDAIDFADTSFSVEVANTDLHLAAIEDLVVAGGADFVQTTVIAQSNGVDVPPELLEYSAHIVTLECQLDAELDLQTAADFYTNWGGQNEKWLRASDGSWYFILPDGSFHRWTGSFGASEQLATFDVEFYEDPNLIADPQSIPVQVEMAGNVLTVNPDAEFVGDFEIQVTVSDGYNDANQIVQVSVEEAGMEDVILPVLMVIPNQDFYYREYSETRESLVAASVPVVVAAATLDTAIPHDDSGQGDDGGFVHPDLTLFDVAAAEYSAIVFVGGWGASVYQYAFEGEYDRDIYNGGELLTSTVNDVINDFVAQGKYVTALCHGVSVLAWARVDGVSPVEGRTVSSFAGAAPRADGISGTTRDQIEANGATVVASRSIGDPTTSADDVVVDGMIITAEDYDSAYAFGAVIAERVAEQEYIDHIDEIFADWQE